MLADLRRSLIALVLATVVLGGLYPLLVTGLAQPLFGTRADGDPRLLGTPRKHDGRPDLGAFLPRPSATDHSTTATAFANLGPNGRDTAEATRANVAAYAEREGVAPARVPNDAAQSSASGIDPDISPANARLQAPRVARARGVPLQRVLAAIEATRAGRALGVLGEPTVNVADLNARIDAVAR